MYAGVHSHLVLLCEAFAAELALVLLPVLRVTHHVTLAVALVRVLKHTAAAAVNN